MAVEWEDEEPCPLCDSRSVILDEACKHITFRCTRCALEWKLETCAECP